MISTRTQEARTRTAILAAVTLLLSLALTAVTPAQPASAAIETCITCVKTRTVGNKPPANNNTKPRTTNDKPRGPRGGGGGGVVDGPEYIQEYTPNRQFWSAWSAYNTYWFPSQPPARLVALGFNGASFRKGPQPSYNGKCSGTTKYGKYLGVKTSQTGEWLVRNDIVRESRQLSGSYTCIEPPHYADTTIDCAATTGATLVGPTRNPDVKSKTKKYPSGKSPFAASGYTNLSLCDDAFLQQYDAATNVMGRYELTGTGKQVTCTVRQYTTPNARTGVTPPDKIVSCGKPFPYMHDKVQWQLWCGGFDLNWNTPRKFTMDECRDTPKWDCGKNFPKAPTFDKVTVPAAGVGVLDDGARRAATWTVPSPTGPAIVKVGTKQVELFVDPSSTPYRGSPATVNGPTQQFVASRQLSTPLTGWGKNSDIWKIGFFAPGLPPTPKKTNLWVATPTWSFVGDFKVASFSKVTVDWSTGLISPPKPVPTTVKAPATCVGLPLQLRVSRARNFR